MNSNEDLLLWVGPCENFDLLHYPEYDFLTEIICVDALPLIPHFQVGQHHFNRCKDEYAFIGAICRKLNYLSMTRKGNVLQFQLAKVVKDDPDHWKLVSSGRTLTYYLNTKMEDFVKEHPEVCLRTTYFCGTGAPWRKCLGSDLVMFPNLKERINYRLMDGSVDVDYDDDHPSEIENWTESDDEELERRRWR